MQHPGTRNPLRAPDFCSPLLCSLKRQAGRVSLCPQRVESGPSAECPEWVESGHCPGKPGPTSIGILSGRATQARAPFCSSRDCWRLRFSLRFRSDRELALRMTFRARPLRRRPPAARRSRHSSASWVSVGLPAGSGQEQAVSMAGMDHPGDFLIAAVSRRSGSSFPPSEMAHPRGFEPLTSAFGGQRSIQLSYGCLGQGDGRLAKAGQGGQTYVRAGRARAGPRARAAPFAACLRDAFAIASSSLPGAGVLGW